jgi:hypothetical protein
MMLRWKRSLCESLPALRPGAKSLFRCTLLSFREKEQSKRQISDLSFQPAILQHDHLKEAFEEFIDRPAAMI